MQRAQCVFVLIKFCVFDKVQTTAYETPTIRQIVIFFFLLINMDPNDAESWLVSYFQPKFGALRGVHLCFLN